MAPDTEQYIWDGLTAYQDHEATVNLGFQCLQFPKWWYCGHQLGKEAGETVKHLCPEENRSRTVFSYPRSKE